MQIIFEDNHILAVNKACGELVQSDITNERTIVDEVKDYLKKNIINPEMFFSDSLTGLTDLPVGLYCLQKQVKRLKD